MWLALYYANEATDGANDRYNAKASHLFIVIMLKQVICLDRKKHDVTYLNVNSGRLKGLFVIPMLRDI